MFGASKYYFGLSEQDTCKNLGFSARHQIGDIAQAWQSIVEVMTGPPPEKGK
jgi:hypothetical protein